MKFVPNVMESDCAEKIYIIHNASMQRKNDKPFWIYIKGNGCGNKLYIIVRTNIKKFNWLHSISFSFLNLNSVASA